VIDSSMFFDGWRSIARVLVLGTIGYAALILILRLSRKRTLAHMNVFDFVCIVVMGELLAISIVSDEVPLAKGLVALMLIVGLQALLSWLASRSKSVEHFVNGEPALLYHQGRFLRDSMRKQRVTEREVLAAARLAGMADLADVDAVVLETDGEFSVTHFGSSRRFSTLRDVPLATEDGDRGEAHIARDGARTRRTG
jgi:uncharacterized membrane protein YcaP (DUF421 family)